MYQFLIFIPAILIGVGGQVILKMGVRKLGEINISQLNIVFLIKIFTNWLIITGLLLSAVAAFFWIIILSKNKLSYVYPLCAGLFYVGIFLSSKFILKENLTLNSILGTIVIFLGIFILSRGN